MMGRAGAGAPSSMLLPMLVFPFGPGVPIERGHAFRSKAAAAPAPFEHSGSSLAEFERELICSRPMRVAHAIEIAGEIDFGEFRSTVCDIRKSSESCILRPDSDRQNHGIRS